MLKPGYIRIMIDRKVYFEYYLLEKPNIKDYKYPSGLIKGNQFEKAIEKYEASKRLVRVANTVWLEDKKYFTVMAIGESRQVFKNNQPCKAEVTDDKATIIELL